VMTLHPRHRKESLVSLNSLVPSHRWLEGAERRVGSRDCPPCIAARSWPNVFQGPSDETTHKPPVQAIRFHGSGSASSQTTFERAAAAKGFANLPDDVLGYVFSLLSAYSLRAAASTNQTWCRALKLAPKPVRRRAAWMHHWTAAGAGAWIHPRDAAVCTGGGTWHPGGIAVASSLQLSSSTNGSFRLVVESAAKGDLLMGITQLLAGRAGTPAPLDMGYHYILGRSGATAGLDEPGVVVAPRSIFYGGRSRRCCFADPGAYSTGPQIDPGPSGRSPGTLAKLRYVGDWVEFSLQDGTLSAIDHIGQEFVWNARVDDGETWVPTVAWTGMPRHRSLDTVFSVPFLRTPTVHMSPHLAARSDVPARQR
jgi:hypothetical protein